MSDYDIDMLGQFVCYWAVLRNDAGVVEVWQSPYQQLPDVDLPEGEPRRGLTACLAQPLTSYSDRELSIAALRMVELAMSDWALASFTNPIYKGLKEQREREGGYVPAVQEDGASDEG